MKGIIPVMILFSIPLLVLAGCRNQSSGSHSDPIQERDAATTHELTQEIQESNFMEASAMVLENLSGNHPYDSVFPQHEPYGTGVGAKPGRVVWTYNPQSVDWDGSGYWWEPGHFNEEVIQQMVNQGIAELAGARDVRTGWDILFRAHNSIRQADGGYESGQKIAIKTNMNGAGAYGDDTKGETQESYTNPVLLKCLLKSLVTEAGVTPGDITVYDAGRVIPDYVRELCSEGSLEGIHFRYRDLLGENDAKPDLNTPVVWSRNVAGEVNYLPVSVTEADYLINLANLKGHVYGITLTAKNHFGSIMNSSRMRAPEAAGVHRYLTQNRMEAYTVLVDLMANYQLGGKTMLYMLDGIICAPGESVPITGDNSRWQQTPFENGYTSSVLFSQDAVALDSVGADFLINEPTVTGRNAALRDNPNVENYLHEAGLIANAPSGTTYYDGNGKPVRNLGVHEHWNNSIDKQYSRNLGKEEGIELIRISGQVDK
ncbi:DUF362 domain-containing protein [Clostridium transplantifaecale]|uniref:DUF362 domain-containing protein n=1 Tax=Clostridium transplantifaecale TaxID=2479838 RepID=UPI0019D1D975|nr:DUF362 domain-containing protein [Clostridium transplantifaecale]